jgi:hypothetical protein
MRKFKQNAPKAFHDLMGMMSHCEANYLILTGILPEKPWHNLLLTTTVGQQLELFFIEEAKYTTTIRIVLGPIKNLQETVKTEWVVRLYHDAELAEVLEDANGRQLEARYYYPNKTMKHPDEKFRMNEHLGDWLMRCVLPKSDDKTDKDSQKFHV